MSWDRGEGQGRHRRRPLLVAGVILLAVVLLGLVARQVPTGDSLAVDDPTPIPSRPSPNITVRTEDEQEPESPSPSPSPLGVPQTRQIDPPLPGVSGLFLWVVSPNGELAHVELGTGASIVADVLEERADQISLVPDGAGGVALTAFSFGRTGESRPDLHAVHVAGPGAPPVDLGAAAQAFPSATAGRVWLLDASVLIAPDVAPSHVREVAADGTVLTTLTLRPGMRVVAVVQGGLLVTAAGDYFVYDPSRGRGPRLDQGQVLAADTRVVVRHVCDETLACWLSVGAIDDPEPRRLEIDQVLEGSLGMGLFYAPPVISPDARWMALVGFEPIGDRGELGQFPAVADLRTGALRRIEDNQVAGQFGPSFTWSADGRWLFWITGRNLSAWNVAEDTVVPLDVGLVPAAMAAG